MGLINEDDPVNCPITEVREKYVVIDGSFIDYSSTASRSSSETSHDEQHEEDPAEEEKWDLPTRNTGDLIKVNVTNPMDQQYDVWAEIVDDFRAVVIPAPRQDLPKLRAGDVIEDVRIIGLRDQYFVCECPPNLEVKYRDPEAFGNTQEDTKNQSQRRLAFDEEYPSTGLLKDKIKRGHGPIVRAGTIHRVSVRLVTSVTLSI